MAPPLERRHGAALETETAGAVQDARPAAADERRRDMAADQAAERESDKMEALARRQDAVDPVDDDGGEPTGRMRRRRLVGFAQPGQIGDDDPVVSRQRRDIAQPMRPRSEAAVEEQQGVPLAPDPPDHGAIAARRL